MNFIEIQNLQYNIGGTHIIKNIDLSIEKGEIVAILGPSGCGKTSFFNILSGLITSSKGQILLESKEIVNRNLLCSYMFQDDLLFPWRRIENNVLIGVEVNDTSNLDNKKEESRKLLDYFGLSDFKNKYPHQLSGGMRRRAAFVRTLLNSERELFLFDEPTAGLDYLLRLQLEEKLYQFLTVNNKTAIIITHDIETAIAMADRILLFAPRPTRILKEYTIALARHCGSTFEAREDADFAIKFQEVLNDYSNYGK